MNRVLRCFVVVVVLSCVVITAGCGEDPKVRITMLEAENQQLLDELNATHSQLMSRQQEAASCQNDLAAARAEASDLRALLKTKHEKPAAPTATPRPVVTAPSGWTQVADGAMISVGGAGLFWPGAVEVREGALPELRRIAGVLNGELAGMQVLVIGHTDSSPVSKTSYTDNREISAQRALSVTRVLEKNGVASARLLAGACGEYRPCAPNTSAGNMEKNRRVEIYAVDPNVMKPAR